MDELFAETFNKAGESIVKFLEDALNKLNGLKDDELDDEDFNDRLDDDNDFSEKLNPGEIENSVRAELEGDKDFNDFNSIVKSLENLKFLDDEK